MSFISYCCGSGFCESGLTSIPLPCFPENHCLAFLVVLSSAHKNALDDLLNREDLNWRKLQLHIAKKLIATEKKSTIRALVVDDSVKMRQGKKMPGISCHFDHLTGCTVMGQQILTLGLATQDRFVPLDREIFISASQAHPFPTAFHDQRSVAARRYQQAKNQSQPQMLEGMVSRALNAGIEAEYFLADAWFAEQELSPCLTSLKKYLS